MIVDTLSRLVSVNEVPLSIITGFVGAIIYAVVLARRGRYINEQ
jgi:iron complex transport system permease protein